MDKTIVLLMGTSGSGKSTLEKSLMRLYPAFYHKIPSVVTREPRPGEQDGVDYRFVTEEEFNQLDAAGQLIQKTEFVGNKYGSLVDDYITEHPFVTLSITPNSALSFIDTIEQLRENRPDLNLNIHVDTLYFDISTVLLYDNMLSRGDPIEDVEVRLAEDDIQQQFADANIEPDIVVTDPMLTHMLPHTIHNQLMVRHVVRKADNGTS